MRVMPQLSPPAALFLFLVSLYWLTMGVGPRTIDEWNVYWVAESMTQGNLTISQAVRANLVYGRPGRGGLYSPTELVPSALAVPFVAVGNALFGRHPSEVLRRFGPGTLACASTGLVSALGAVFLALLLGECGLSSRRATGWALLYGTGTIAWPYSAYLFREPHLTTALLAAAWCLARLHREQDWPARRPWLLRAALAAGLAFGCKRELLFSLPALCWLLLAGRLRESDSRQQALRETALFLCGPALAVVLQLTYNLARFGNLLEFGYPRLDETGAPLVAFSTPLLTGLYGFLLSPGKSMFLFSPILLLTPWALWRARQSPLVQAAALLLGLNLLILSQWNHWEGGWCWGPRHTVPLVPFAIATIALAGERSVGTAIRISTALLWLWGLAAQLLGVLVDYFTYAAESGRYMHNLNEYQLDFSPWAGHLQLVRLFTARLLRGEAPGFDLWQELAVTTSGTGGAALAGAMSVFLLLGLVWSARNLLLEPPGSPAKPHPNGGSTPRPQPGRGV